MSEYIQPSTDQLPQEPIMDHVETLENDEVERKKEIQVKIIQEWAIQQDPPLIEGVDYFMPSINDIDRNDENIAPHELGALYFGFKKEYFKKITEFFSTQYPEAMLQEQVMTKPWNSEVSFNYSWGGRYLVSGEGGVAIDTVPLESIDPPLCKSEHAKFKEFFHEQTGIDFPSLPELNDITKTMSTNLPWYTEAVRLLEEKQKTSPEPWGYDQPIYSLKYAVIILSDANELSETEENLEKLKENGAQSPELEDKISKLQLAELPEEFSDIRDKIRHYNDLTYNADDWVDLDHVNELLGKEYPPPSEKGARIDKIYEDYYNFDRKKFEQLCKDFSGMIYAN
jgi:hypothetical protein